MTGVFYWLMSQMLLTVSTVLLYYGMHVYYGHVVLVFLFNAYSGWATLVVHGPEEFLYSRDGVTQGDPQSCFYMLLVPCL